MGKSPIIGLTAIAIAGNAYLIAEDNPFSSKDYHTKLEETYPTPHATYESCSRLSYSSPKLSFAFVKTRPFDIKYCYSIKEEQEKSSFSINPQRLTKRKLIFQPLLLDFLYFPVNIIYPNQLAHNEQLINPFALKQEEIPTFKLLQKTARISLPIIANHIGKKDFAESLIETHFIKPRLQKLEKATLAVIHQIACPSPFISTLENPPDDLKFKKNCLIENSPTQYLANNSDIQLSFDKRSIKPAPYSLEKDRVAIIGSAQQKQKKAKLPINNIMDVLQHCLTHFASYPDETSFSTTFLATQEQNNTSHLKHIPITVEITYSKNEPQLIASIHKDSSQKHLVASDSYSQEKPAIESSLSTIVYKQKLNIQSHHPEEIPIYLSFNPQQCVIIDDPALQTISSFKNSLAISSNNHSSSRHKNFSELAANSDDTSYFEENYPIHLNKNLIAALESENIKISQALPKGYDKQSFTNEPIAYSVDAPTPFFHNNQKEVLILSSVYPSYENISLENFSSHIQNRIVLLQSRLRYADVPICLQFDNNKITTLKPYKTLDKLMLDYVLADDLTLANYSYRSPYKTDSQYEPIHPESMGLYKVERYLSDKPLNPQLPAIKLPYLNYEDLALAAVSKHITFPLFSSSYLYSQTASSVYRAKELNNQLRLTTYQLEKLPKLDELKTYDLTDEFANHLAIAAKPDGSGYYFALDLKPHFAERLQPIKQNIYFVIDKNEFTHYQLLDSYNKAIMRSLNYIYPDDVFNIMVFDGKLHKYQNNPVHAQAPYVKAAQKFLKKQTKGLKASRKNMSWLLAALNEEANKHPDEVHTVILFSNGASLYSSSKINQKRIQNALKAFNKNFTIYPAYISKKGNTRALEQLSQFYRGTMVSSKTHAAFSRYVAKQVKQLKRPIAQNINVTPVVRYNQNINILPEQNHFPVMYSHKPFTIYGFTNSIQPFELLVQAKVNGEWIQAKIKLRIDLAENGGSHLRKKCKSLESKEAHISQL